MAEFVTHPEGSCIVGLWERNLFAMSGDELDKHEARMALERVIDHCGVSEDARRVLQQAVEVLTEGPTAAH